jgi:HSP20 family protein
MPIRSAAEVVRKSVETLKESKEEKSMSIVRYDPFRDLRTLQEEVNRLFSTNLTRGFGEEAIGRGAWNPTVDIYENKDQIVLEAELPGMKSDDFELSIENNVITLRGERRFEKKDDTDNYHRVERSYGAFTRSFTLPQTVSAEGAKAEYNHGVLRVTLPKREEAKSRRIEISGAGATGSSKTLDTKAENVENVDKAKAAGTK